MNKRFQAVQMPSHEQIGRALAAMRQATEAEAIEITAAGGPHTGMLVLLPSLVDQSNLRLRWDRARASVVEGGHVEASWTISDREWGTVTGSVVIDAATRTVSLGAIGTASIDVQRFTSARDLTNRIERLRQTANAERFELLLSLEPFVKSRASASSVQISHEIAESRGIDLSTGIDHIGSIDQIEQDQVVCEVLFGNANDTSDRQSIALKMLERAAGDLDSNVGDTRRYFAVNLSSAVETAVRRKIGDPHIGRNVRALSQSLGTRDVDTLLEAMRRQKPNALIGEGRIQAALNASPSPYISKLSLDVGNHDSEDSLLNLIAS